MRLNFVIKLIVLSLLVSGCASGKPKKKSPTQKEAATRQWNAARSNVLLSLAKDQYETGNFDKCRQSVGEAMKLSPESSLARVLSAKLAIEQSQLELADAELKIARQLDPKNAEVDYLDGIVLQRWQKNDQAYDAYAAACDKNPSELAYLMARAEMLVVLDRRAEALTVLQERIVFFEHSAAIREAAAHLLMHASRYAEAADLFRQASILSNDDPRVQQSLAMAFYYNGQYRESADVLIRLVKDESFSERADLLLTLGECQLQLNKPRDARVNFDRAATLMPGSSGAWLGLAKASLATGDNERASMAIKRVVALAPASSEANLLLGYLKLREGSYMSAVTAFQKASLADNKDTVSLCMTGYALEKLGQRDEAMTYYGRALNINPTDELAAKLLAGVELNQ